MQTASLVLLVLIFVAVAAAAWFVVRALAMRGPGIEPVDND
jgi:hypothetical protein